MEERLELEGGGLLEIREDGARAQLSVRRGLDGAGLYKVWIQGGQGELLLGTLTPEGQYLRLERTMSKSALAQAGCWPVTGGRTALVFSFLDQEALQPQPSWRWEHRPGGRLGDPVLRESAASWGPMLIRESQHGFELAAPLDPERPFPMTPLFCFAQVLRVDGQLHAAFAFDLQGNPQPPVSGQHA